MGETLKIVGHTNSGGAGRWLRVEQFLHVLSRNKLAKCKMLYPESPAEETVRALCAADIVLTAGGMSAEQVVEMRRLVDLGKLYVVDVDDLPDRVSPLNPAYRSFGLEEVECDFGDNYKTAWVDGVDGFDVSRNRANFAAYESFLRECSGLTVTTAYMRDLMGERYGQAPFIRPNLADFKTVWKRRNSPSRDGKVRIMYQGGSSHIADLAQIMPALEAVAKEHPHVVFQFFGDTFAFAERVLPSEQIERFEWEGDLRYFALRLSLLSSDIGIVPLSTHPEFIDFNRAKSPLKWLDYACVGMPSVCQWETPYQEVVNFGYAPGDRWNGMLARTHEDWFTCLDMLIRNPDMRRVIGTNAYEEARADWDLDVWAPEILRQFEEVASGHHHALNPA